METQRRHLKKYTKLYQHFCFWHKISILILVLNVISVSINNLNNRFSCYFVWNFNYSLIQTACKLIKAEDGHLSFNNKLTSSIESCGRPGWLGSGNRQSAVQQSFCNCLRFSCLFDVYCSPLSTWRVCCRD